jgi:hypothetical protein
MRGLIAVGFAATLGLLAGPAAAQGFGQVTFGTAPGAAPTPTPASTDAAKPAGNNVDGVTVTGKRIPDSQKDPNEVLCHEEVPIGTRFAKTICATRRAYAERRQWDREELEKWTALRPYKAN